MIQGGGLSSLFEAIQYYELIEVSDYQRNYAWSTNDVEELYKDVLKLTENPREFHFTGSLILQQEDTDSGKPTRCEVVDGQQRLTSFFLLVARIRDLLQELPSATIEPDDPNELTIDVLRLARTFLYEPSGKKKDLKFRSNTLLSAQFLKNMMQEKPRIEPPGKDRTLKDLSLPLRKAYLRIDSLLNESLGKIEASTIAAHPELNDPERLGQLVAREKLVFLHKATTAIRDQVLVLKVLTNRVDESLDVFMTLNARGVPLGPSDLVRGQVLQNMTAGKTPQEMQLLFTEMMQEWKLILENVEGADTEQFFRHFLVSQTGETVTKRRVVEIANGLMMSKKDPNNLGERLRLTHEFWTSLSEASEAYKKLLKPDVKDPWGYHLKVLLNVASSYRILLMEIFNGKHKLSHEDLAEVVRLCYVLVFKYFGAGKNAQDLEVFFANKAKQFRSNSSLSQLMAELTHEADFSFEIREYFEQRLDSPVWVKAVLHALNNDLKGKANHLDFDTTTLHIEHIVPQKHENAWLDSALPPGSTWDNYDDLVESLGNQTLLDENLNKSAKAQSFTLKKVEYEKSSPVMTKDLSKLDSWDSELVELRLKWLVESYKLIFTNDKQESKVVQFSEWLKQKI